MKRTPSQIGNIFGVDRNVVKKWSYHFKDYLSDSANPPKGEVREFNDDDIPILAYINEHWEEEPDMEHIKIGLNREDYQENCYLETLYFNSPIFYLYRHTLELYLKILGEVSDWTHELYLNIDYNDEYLQNELVAGRGPADCHVPGCRTGDPKFIVCGR